MGAKQSDVLAGRNQEAAEADFINQQARQDRSNTALLDNFFTGAQNNFNSTVAFTDSARAAGDAVRSEGLARNRVLQDRRLLGNEAARVSTDRFNVNARRNTIDPTSEEVRFSAIQGIAAQTGQELEQLSLNIILAATLPIGSVAGFGFRTTVNGLLGSAANVTATNATSLFDTGEFAGLNDNLQAFNTGFIGGVVGDRRGGKTGAALGGLSSEAVNQGLNQELNLTKLVLAPTFGALGQRGGDLIDERVGGALSRFLPQSSGSTVGVVSSLLSTKGIPIAIDQGFDALQRTGVNTSSSVGSEFVDRGLRELNQLSADAAERQRQEIRFQLQNDIFPLPRGGEF